MLEEYIDKDALFEGLELSVQEQIGAYALLEYILTRESSVRRRLMDGIVDVRDIELHPEGQGKWSKAKPINSEIDCPALTKLLDDSLEYLYDLFDNGWRHSDEEMAEEIRTKTLELLECVSPAVIVRDMGTDMCEFVVRLSRWVRQ